MSFINSGEVNERTGLLQNSHHSLTSSSTHSTASQSASSNRGVSWVFAVFLIVNAALGAGLLNFGKSFDAAGGILISSLIQIGLVILICGSLIILAYCTDATKSSNYQDVIYNMCGPKWQTINSICILLYTYGTCVTYFIVIGDQLDQIFSCIFGEAALHEHWYFDRKYTITITCLIFVLPLCYPKNIDFLTYPSTFAVIAIFYVAILIPVKYAMLDTKDVVIKTKPDYWADVFSVIPVICFSYQCHVNAVPLYVCLKKKTLGEFTKSIIASIFIIFTVYTLSGTFGYLTFGSKINDDLLKSYDPRDATVLIAVIMYLFKTYTTYPLNLFCARTAIESLWIKFFQLDEQRVRKREFLRRFLIVTIWFVTTLLIAVFIPNISIVIAYLGALASGFMFTFPGLCLLFVGIERMNNINVGDEGDRLINSINAPSESLKNYNRNTRLLLFISVVYIGFGTFVAGLVITQAVIADFFS